MAQTVIVTFRCEEALYNRFRAVAKERGHTMTWYLTGCMREIAEGRRRKGGKPKKAVQKTLPM